MGHVGSKMRSLGQMIEKLCVCCIGHMFSPIIMKLDKNVFLNESQTSSKVGHVGSSTWSLGQMIEKPCVGSRGQILSPIIMKLGQNLCLDEI